MTNGNRGAAAAAEQTATITLLLTDIEGSTRFWETQPDRMHEALARHDHIITSSVEGVGGTVVQSKAEGDSTFSVFDSPVAAATAALRIQRALAEEKWPTDAPVRVRMGVHTGEVEIRHGDYFGVEISRCARLRGSGHGGQILLSSSTAEAVRHALPDEAFLKDLGQHRLKDLDRAERVYQLCHPRLPSDFPQLATLSALRHNLPVHLSPLIGRREEAAVVEKLVAQDRLVTLTGTGGSGKTRLALQVAGNLVDAYTDGVWLVELGSLSDEGLVARATAHALGIREQVGRGLEAALLNGLAGRHLLLVLDNCEHVLNGCARLARALLLGVPRLHVLATSRQRLGVAGETVWPVPPLDLPPADPPPPVDEIRRHAAVELFLERVTRVHPGFVQTEANVRDIAEICRRLDGIPLAIELAAARVTVLTPAQILERLADRFRLLTSGEASFARHQTLRTAVDWSYDLLSAEERRSFDRLAVFVGGCTIDAAEHVCRADTGSVDVLDVLARLVDKSLLIGDVRDGIARFHMLETVREYAAEKLDASGEADAARRRLLEWLTGFAEQAEPELTGPDQVLWHDSIDAEHANIRTALSSGLARRDDAELVSRLAGALWRYWLERGHVGEGRDWLSKVLRLGEGVSPAVRGKALRAAGALAMWQSDLQAAKRFHGESVAIARSIGDELGLAASLSHLGIVSWRTGDIAAAKGLLEESLAIRRAHGDRPGESTSLGNLGLVAQAEGDYAAAQDLLEQSLTIDRELGDKLGIAGSLTYLGELARESGDHDRAEALHRDGLAQQRELRQREVLPMALEGMAGLAVARGDNPRGARLFGAAESLRRAIGLPLPPSAEAAYDRDVGAARSALGDDRFEQLWKQGRDMTLDDAISYALALEPEGKGEEV